MAFMNAVSPNEFIFRYIRNTLSIDKLEENKVKYLFAYWCID